MFKLETESWHNFFFVRTLICQSVGDAFPDKCNGLVINDK